MDIKITHRGWPGHYFLGDKCVFHLNTLIEYGDTRIVVSTVGNLQDNNRSIQEVGAGRYYETMAFYAKWDDEAWETDVNKPFNFTSQWQWNKPEDDYKANDGHFVAVQEITDKLINQTSQDAEDL